MPRPGGRGPLIGVELLGPGAKAPRVVGLRGDGLTVVLALRLGPQ